MLGQDIFLTHYKLLKSVKVESQEEEGKGKEELSMSCSPAERATAGRIFCSALGFS